MVGRERNKTKKEEKQSKEMNGAATDEPAQNTTRNPPASEGVSLDLTAATVGAASVGRRTVFSSSNDSSISQTTTGRPEPRHRVSTTTGNDGESRTDEPTTNMSPVLVLSRQTSISNSVSQTSSASTGSSKDAAIRRLMRDFQATQKDMPEGIEATPHPDNIMVWDAILFGPDDTAWEGGVFKLQLEFPETYPQQPPKAKFLTKMFHPNIYVNGQICLDIMKSQWSPTFDVKALLLSIQSLLADPNPASAANPEAADCFLNKKQLYAARVKEVVELSLEYAEAEDEEEKAA